MNQVWRDFCGRGVRYVIMSIAVLPLVLATAPGVRAETQSIDGDPLDIHCQDTGLMALWFQDVYQYYSEDAWGSVLMFDSGETTMKYADPYHQDWGDYMTEFTPVTNGKPGPWQIDTVMDAGDSGVRITQSVQYTNGFAYYKMTWTITNQGSSTYTNCKFFHGGDAYFAGDDRAQSFWDEGLGMVYLRNPGLSGIMGFYGGLGSRADRYYGGYYGDGNDMAVDVELSNTVDPEFLDAGYYLQWNRASLAPGETWTITAYEKWTDAGNVQVMAPAEQTGTEGGTVSLSFIVQNFQEASDTFTLAAASDLGWQTSLPGGGSVTLDGGESATVTVQVTVPADSESLTDTVTLTATSQADPSVTNTDSVQVTSTASTEPPVAPPAAVHRHHGDRWCFISTAETSSGFNGVLVLTACVFLGLGCLVRRWGA